MLSLFSTPKTGSTEESRENASLEPPSFRAGPSDGTEIEEREQEGGRTKTWDSPVYLKLLLLLGSKDGKPNPKSSPYAARCKCPGDWSQEAAGGLTFITERSLPGSPLETLNNAVLH